MNLAVLVKQSTHVIITLRMVIGTLTLFKEFSGKVRFLYVYELIFVKYSFNLIQSVNYGIFMDMDHHQTPAWGEKKIKNTL